MNEPELEVVSNNELAVTKAEAMPVDKPSPPQPQITAAQSKIEAVAHLTMAAYERASLLKLTPEEVERLQAEFPDDAFQPGAAGKENLIYIEHAHLRDRLNQVLGLGQWAIIPRSRWSEPFQTYKGTAGERVYVEGMLLIRGAFVAEAIGAMEYYPKNESQNYGDAVEGAKTACLRRCCKELGVGLQAWKKEWCEGWWSRRRSGTRTTTKSAPPAAAAAPVSKPAATTAAAPEEKPRVASANTRKWMLDMLSANPEQANRQLVSEYFEKLGALFPTEPLESLDLKYVPVSKSQLALLHAAVRDFEAGGEAKEAFRPNESTELGESAVKATSDHNAPDAPWRSFPMPFGKSAGVALCELEKNYLYGLWANWTPEETYNGKPKKPEYLAKDKVFRAMLDEAGKHYEFTKKD